MFNTLDEHLFSCQSLLKERRQPPTGGLREALEESLGGRVSTPSSPIVGSKMTPGASEIWVVYCFERSCPHRDVSCRSLFFCGNHERACFDRVQNPESFEVPFLRRKSSPSLTN